MENQNFVNVAIECVEKKTQHNKVLYGEPYSMMYLGQGQQETQGHVSEIEVFGDFLWE